MARLAVGGSTAASRSRTGASSGCDLESRIPRGIGGDDAQPAPIGHDEEPAAAWQGLAGEPARDIEELLDRAHAKRPRLLDRRVERAIGARQRAGMRGDGAGALRGPPRLQQHHRLHRRRRAQRLEEPPSVRHALDVGGDDARLGIRGHRVEDIRLGDVGLVAEAREEREAHAALARPVEDGDGERAGVRDEGDAARLRHTRREGEVEAARRPDPAEAVRPEDPDRLIAEPRAQLGLSRPPLLARFAEARGDHHRAGHALGDALHERGQHRRSGYGDHGEVHRSLDGEDRRRGPNALHHVRVRIDREDPPGEARRAQVGQHAPSDLGRVA